MGEIAAFSVVIILLLVAYWSLVIYPKQRDFKSHNQYVQTLEVGEEVVTFGGIIGVISRLDLELGVAYVKVAEGVELKMLSAALSRPYVPEEVAKAAALGVDPAAKPS